MNRITVNGITFDLVDKYVYQGYGKLVLNFEAIGKDSNAVIAAAKSAAYQFLGSKGNSKGLVKWEEAEVAINGNQITLEYKK